MEVTFGGGEVGVKSLREKDPFLVSYFDARTDQSPFDSTRNQYHVRLSSVICTSTRSIDSLAISRDGGAAAQAAVAADSTHQLPIECPGDDRHPTTRAPLLLLPKH
jgi:hypothetical protein